MNRSELEQHIARFELGQLGDELTASMRRALRLCPLEIEGHDNSSRFGGLPYAPHGFVWPFSSPPKKPNSLRYESHQYVEGPMRFICQINLSEIPYVPDGIRIEPEGLLLFFASTHKVDFPLTDCTGEDWLVVRTDCDGGSLCAPPRLTPEFIEALDDYSDAPTEDGSIVHPNLSIDFEEHWQMNPSLLYGTSAVSHELDLRLADMPMHLFGGFPDYLQCPIEKVAAQYRNIPLKPIESLAQFDSDTTIGLTWSGGGRGYFMAPRLNQFLDLQQTILITQQ